MSAPALSGAVFACCRFAEIRFKYFSEHDRCTLQVYDVALDRALFGVLSAGRANRPKFDCRFDGGTYIIDLPKISLHLSNSTFTDALRAIFAKSDIDFVYWGAEIANKHVSLDLASVTVDQAVALLLTSANVSHKYVVNWRGGVYILRPMSKGHATYFTEGISDPVGKLSVR